MALTDGNGDNGMVMPVQPMGNYGGFGGMGGFGGFGGDWSLIIVLFLFAMLGGGWGGMGGFGNNALGFDFPWLLNGQQGINANTNAGFNQAATQGQLNGIQNSINTGFSNAEVAACNRATDALQTAYQNQIAGLERSFAAQTANTQALTGIQSQLADCCCENRLATANLQSVIQAENCADREAVNTGVRDILANQTASVQRILDKLCDQELQAERRENDQLRQQLNMANLAASQNAQTSRLLADNAAQTQQIENYVRPQINPAYIVPNPYAYNFPYFGWNNGGCGCGNSGFNGSF